MDQDVMITIGIPFHNAGQFIERAIRSVLDQTYKNFELILSDDGSNDSSLRIAESFTDPRIIILSDGKNKGISYRLNEQISMARGGYFARMDADDIMLPNRIRNQVDFLTAHSNIDVIGSPVIIINDKDKEIGLRTTIVPENITGAFLHNAFIHPTVMGKTEWFKKYGYAEDLIGAEDYDLWIRSFSHSSFFVMKDPVLYYRDPVNQKLSRYLFRQKQIRRSQFRNRGLLKNPSYILILGGISLLKSVAYLITNAIGIDSLLIKKRNRSLDAGDK